ncbi:uncharacterized protein LOC114524971 [Dendronephthya gigantea]|uniref:uncharacterized protein LOC114524971 n=1 Tax=Dendronephthya gigantea TaxID=151771 RepID=UPI00106D82CF|nr:uncharacterized protein LOC114524971 [Dendronephthya gigantea]
MGTLKSMRSWLFVVSVAYCLCLTPVTSQEKKNCKPGRCPAFKGGRICPEQFEIDDECHDDFECTGNKKCCSDGCQLKCLAPSSVDTEPKPNDLEQYCKPGECPLFAIRDDCPHFWELQDDCYFDFQCPKDQKCCSDGCELRCMAIKVNVTIAAPTTKPTGPDPTKDIFVGVTETTKSTAEMRVTTGVITSDVVTPFFPTGTTEILPTETYYFRVVIYNAYRFDVTVTTSLKEEKYRTFVIPGQQNKTIDIERASSENVKFTAKNPSDQPVLLNNAFSQQIPGTRSYQAPQNIYIGARVTTKAPEVVTEAPEMVTEAPEVVTKAPEVTTKAPEVVTESPEVVTKAPEVTTKVPEVETDAPEMTTKAAEVVTKAPEVVTEAPEVVTEAPEVVTEAPEVETDAPEVTTKAPEEVTEAPEVTTKAPGVETEAPEVMTEAPQVVTEAPEKTTKAPEVVTEAPEVVTEAPQVVTQAPEVVTEAPKKTTKAPEVVTEAPEVVTEAPQVVTQAPEVVTEAPEKTTKAPEVLTEAPEVVTEAPQVVTQAPEVVTQAPEKTTKAPEVGTGAPEVVTEAPQVVTKAPEVVTEAPGVVTKAPEVTTKAPDVVTEAPEVVTDAPQVTTKAPEVVTEAPEVVTDAPEVVTKAPEVVTDGPDVVTEAPEVVTEAPEVVTEAPEVVTEAPKVVTQAPEVVTEAPEVVTEAPEVVTEAPEVVTEAPEVVTQAPEVATKAPEVGTGAPEVVTEAPQVVTQAPEVVTEAPEKTTKDAPEVVTETPQVVTDAPVVTTEAPEVVTDAPEVTTKAPEVVTEAPEVVTDAPEVTEAPEVFTKTVTPGVTYNLDVTIVNDYGRAVRILSNHMKYQKFEIPVGGRYQIKSSSSERKTIYISAFDVETFDPVKIDGKNSLAVTNSIESIARIYYIPSAPTAPPQVSTKSLPTPVTGIDTSEAPEVTTKAATSAPSVFTGKETEQPSPPAGVDVSASTPKAPKVTTKAPEKVTEAPQVVTEEPTVVTEAPEVVTEAPEMVTEAPKVVTEAPEVVTEAPEVVTEAPEVVTETPEVVTEAPEVVTDAPEVVTEAPEVVTDVMTDAPEVVTEAPEVVTEAPEVGTDAPEVVTEAPEEVTEAPEVVTEAPEVVTEAPEVTTKAPEVVTDAPEVVTETPEVVTEAPEVVTDAPVVVTDGPEVTTEAPEMVTDAPEVTTDAPEVITKAPEVLTKAPEVTTKAPEILTDAPEVITKAPEVTTKAVASTESPVYYVNIRVVNDYGYDIDVRSSSDVIDDFEVPKGEERNIQATSNTAESFVIRFYDRRDGIPILVKGENYVRIMPRTSPLFVHDIVVEAGEIKFYVVFLLVNNYDREVVVSTGLSGTSGSITMRAGQTFAVSEQPNNDNPIIVTARDSSNVEVNINDQSSISITPDEVFGASFQVLFLHRKDPIPTVAPGETVYYVTFIITNTYGRHFDLRTSLPSPYNRIRIIKDQTVRMAIRVPTREDVTFEAALEAGEQISVNGKDVFLVTPRENPKKVTVLTVPDAAAFVEVISTRQPIITEVPSPFYVKFSLTNTYGKDITLNSNLPDRYSSMNIPSGHSLSLTVHVNTQDLVWFTAVDRDTGMIISINGKERYWITPRDNEEFEYVLVLEEKTPDVRTQAPEPSTAAPEVRTKPPTAAPEVTTQAPVVTTKSTTPSPAVETTARTTDRVAFYLPMRVENRYAGAIKLKTNLPSPNGHFKIQPGMTLVKIISLASSAPVSISALSVLTNEKLLVNGLPVFITTPSEVPTAAYIKLEVTEVTTVSPSPTTQEKGCIKNSGELVKIGEEYSEDNCSRLCVCTSNGIECRTMCPDKIFNLLECKLPYILKFIAFPVGPKRLDCFCTRVDCVLPETVQTTIPKVTPKTTLEPGEPPVIRRNPKAIDIVAKHKRRYKTVIGSSVTSPTLVAITIVCAADGKPTPEYTWTKNGEAVIRSSNVKILSRGSRLRIKSLTSNNIGRYECTARNAFGVDTAMTNLSVWTPIKFFAPVSFTNSLNKEVEIRTTLKKPFDVIFAQPKQQFRYILRPPSMGRVSIFAYEKESRQRLLVNRKFTVSLLPNRTISRYWPINITTAATKEYLLYLNVENKFQNDVRLVTTMTEPQFRNTTIRALRTQSLRFSTSSRSPVTITAYDSASGKRVKINNRDYVSLIPSTQTARAVTLSITSIDRPVWYYFILSAINRHHNEVQLESTMEITNSTFDIRPGAELNLTVKTNSPNEVSFRAYDKISGYPVLINRRPKVDLLPVKSLASPRQVMIIADAHVAQKYYVAFKIKNNYQNSISVRTTLRKPYQEFQVLPSDTFSIEIAIYDDKDVIIQALESASGRPVTLNGRQTIVLKPQASYQTPRLFSAPNEYQQLHFVTFKLRNTLDKAIVLQANLPSPYQTVVLKPGEIFILNTTIPRPRPVFISAFYDHTTNRPARINGKTFFIIYPTTKRVVKVSDTPSPRGQYPLRFSIENKFDKKIYITTTLPRPYGLITFDPKQKITFKVNVTSRDPVTIKAYDFHQNTEVLPINDKFSIELTPGSKTLVPLAIPSRTYAMYYLNFQVYNNLGRDIILSSRLDAPHDSIRVLAGQTLKMKISTPRNLSTVFTATEATHRRRVKLNGKDMIILMPSKSQDIWQSIYIPARVVYYVAFGVKNSYGKDIYLTTNMQPPHNTINIPKDQQIQRTIVLLDQNLVNVRARDAATRQVVKIDDRDFITLKPNRSKPTTLRIYHVPKEGPYFLSVTIKNLYREAILLQTNLQSETYPNIQPGDALTRTFKQERSGNITFMAYDTLALESVTLNGKNKISLIPTTQRRQPIVIYVPYKGCPLPNGRLLKVGEQYTNDECTRLCTCNEKGVSACVALCPTAPISVCSPPLVQKRSRVPTGPADGKCTCEQVICVEEQTTTDNSTEVTVPSGAVNQALGRYASQSNVSLGGYAYLATDGIRSGNYGDSSCTHTPPEENPFWYVSFEPYKVNISVIRITNRQDCCRERLSDFEIRIGDYFGEDAEKSPKCGDRHTISGDSKVISCRGMVGGFLTIRIPGKRKILTLCEVEVFGTQIPGTDTFRRRRQPHGPRR